MPALLDYRAYPILVVDDDPDIVATFRFAFEHEFTVLGATSGRAALELLKREPVAVLVCDQRMPDMDGVEVITRALELRPDLVPIVLTGFTDYQALVTAMNVGRIFRYIPKPWDATELREALRTAIEHAHLASENARLSTELAAANERLRQEVNFHRSRERPALGLAELIGNSPAIARIRKLVEVVKDENTTVLIIGPTGTGKELVARGTHFEGVRRDMPFLPINCAAVPDGLIESELFGYKRGAHDKAFRDSPGLFEVANGGTLFLDEIAVTTQAFQNKLLRAIETSEILPLGAKRPVRVDVRVIVATSRDLEQEVAHGRFLPDLYYRLRVFPIVMPPLASRREDIPLLVAFFLAKHAERYRKPVPPIAEGAMAELVAQDYPGNVRELSHLIERAVLLVAPDTPITTEELFDRPLLLASSPYDEAEHNGAVRDGEVGGRKETLATLMASHERALLVAALERNGWNRGATARDLGISYRWLLRLMKKHGLGGDDGE